MWRSSWGGDLGVHPRPRPRARRLRLSLRICRAGAVSTEPPTSGARAFRSSRATDARAGDSCVRSRRARSRCAWFQHRARYEDVEIGPESVGRIWIRTRSHTSRGDRGGRVDGGLTPATSPAPTRDEDLRPQEGGRDRRCRSRLESALTEHPAIALAVVGIHDTCSTCVRDAEQEAPGGRRVLTSPGVPAVSGSARRHPGDPLPRRDAAQPDRRRPGQGSRDERRTTSPTWLDG